MKGKHGEKDSSEVYRWDALTHDTYSYFARKFTAGIRKKKILETEKNVFEPAVVFL